MSYGGRPSLNDTVQCILQVPTVQYVWVYGRQTVIRLLMGKLCANYAYHIFQRTKAQGKTTHRRHAHMHTHESRGINTNLAANIQQNFTWTPPWLLNWMMII